MTPLALLLEARKRGLDLAPGPGGNLAVRPKGACDPEFAELLRRHKLELLAWLNQAPCPGWRSLPPVDLGLNPLQPRPAPVNARRVVDYIVRQIDGTDALCEWCLRREGAYWDLHGWPHEDCCYAASRDAACWQLGRDERGVWELLAGIAECSPVFNP